MVSTKQKPIVNTQKIKRKESKHTTTENHQITKEDMNRGRNRGTTKQPENNEKVRRQSHYSSIKNKIRNKFNQGGVRPIH